MTDPAKVRNAKRWTPEDQRILDDAFRTGRLPDGRGASQNRLAAYLGFSRQTIVTRLNGRQLPLHYEAMSQGGSRGGKMTAYIRRVKRVVTMLQGKKIRTVRTVIDKTAALHPREILGDSLDAIGDIQKLQERLRR